jgi:hypothetical protein
MEEIFVWIYAIGRAQDELAAGEKREAMAHRRCRKPQLAIVPAAVLIRQLYTFCVLGDVGWPGRTTR